MLFNPQMVQSAMNMLTRGMLKNHPLLQQFNQITSGQMTYEDKKEAVLKYGEKLGYSRKDMEEFLNSQNTGEIPAR